MNISGESTVPAPRAAVFDKLKDAPFFASCLEGVKDLKEIDATHYDAVLETKVKGAKKGKTHTLNLSKVLATEVGDLGLKSIAALTNLMRLS